MSLLRIIERYRQRRAIRKTQAAIQRTLDSEKVVRPDSGAAGALIRHAGEESARASRLREFKLIPAAEEALASAAAVTGLSQVDVVNRALQLYAMVEGRRTHSDKLCLVDPDGLLFHIRMDGEPT